MKIGIIGTATVGGTLAERFAECGHQVLIANRRSPNSLNALVAQSGHPLHAVTVEDVLNEAELILLALPWRNIRDVLGEDRNWQGRVIIDATNIFLSYAPDFKIDDLQGDSGSEIIARLAPSARIVKAFNTLPFDILFTSPPVGMRRVLFVAGDDQQGVGTVTSLIDEIGFQPVAIGSLATAGREMELGGALNRLELYASA